MNQQPKYLIPFLQISDKEIRSSHFLHQALFDMIKNQNGTGQDILLFTNSTNSTYYIVLHHPALMRMVIVEHFINNPIKTHFYEISKKWNILESSNI